MDEYMKSNNSVKIVFTSFPYMYLKGIWNPPIFNNTFINIVFSVLFVQLFAEIKLLKYIFVYARRIELHWSRRTALHHKV